MPIYDTFQKAAFNGIVFPYSQIAIKGGIRHHVHEYPHSAGGDVEKMGRKLYTFRFRVPFHDLPGSDLERDFQGLFPDRLKNFLALFDRQATAELVVPSIGTMKCVATDWDGTADMAEALSGETWNFEFIEDEDRASLVKEIPNLGVHALKASALELQTKADKHGFKPGLFQAINDAVTAVDAVFGVADQNSRLVAAKISAVADLCGRADREIDEFLNPMNHLVLEALKNLWANAVDLAENAPGVAGGELVTYRVPRLMSIGEVATNLYGSADRGADIMVLNPIDDPFEIKKGTNLKYLKDAA